MTIENRLSDLRKHLLFKFHPIAEYEPTFGQIHRLSASFNLPMSDVSSEIETLKEIERNKKESIERDIEKRYAEELQTIFAKNNVVLTHESCMDILELLYRVRENDN